MTPEQQKIVEANMGLVGKVIKEKVRRLGQPDTPSYEDLFQAGCIGLCEAAITDKGGCFSTYAYRLIWNEICDELIRNTKLFLNEQSTDTVDVLSEAASAHPDPLTIFDLRHTIGQAKAKAQGGTARGIQCLELTVQGYTSKEIGAIVGCEHLDTRRPYEKINTAEGQAMVCTTGLDPLNIYSAALCFSDWLCSFRFYGTHFA